MIDNNSVFSSTQFMEFPYRKSLLHGAMKAPHKEIEELTGLAEENKKRTPNVIVLTIQKVWHRIKILFSEDYRKKFISAAKKIDLYEATKKIERENAESPIRTVKNNMLKAIGEKIDPRMQEAWSALLSDCGEYVKSWNCDERGEFTLEFIKPLNIWIPANEATILLAAKVSGTLDKASKRISFSSGLKTTISGIFGQPYIFWQSYIKETDVIAIRGGYTTVLAQTQNAAAATLIENWSHHQLV